MATRLLAVPKDPKGIRRPANTFEAATMVGRISTGEIEHTRSKAPERAAALSPSERKQIAAKAAAARWKR